MKPATEMTEELKMKESEPVSFAAEVWETLSGIDCSEHVKEKGAFTYLSWVWAWGILMENFPESRFVYMEPVYHSGTVEMQVSVTVKKGDDNLIHSMWLPVMNHKHQAIEQPDSRQISDTRMRCLVKCIAMFGLGHYIYAGEDIPREEDAKQIHRFKAGEKESIIERGLKALTYQDKGAAEDLFSDYEDEDPAVKNKVWYLFESADRAQLKILLADE